VHGLYALRDGTKGAPVSAIRMQHSNDQAKRKVGLFRPCNRRRRTHVIMIHVDALGMASGARDIIQVSSLWKSRR
jgi:hypothetical protein